MQLCLILVLFQFKQNDKFLIRYFKIELEQFEFNFMSNILKINLIIGH